MLWLEVYHFSFDFIQVIIIKEDILLHIKILSVHYNIQA